MKEAAQQHQSENYRNGGVRLGDISLLVASRAYAIGIFHGGNLNNRLDNYFFGVSHEQYGFNTNARGFMGPPSFEDATFSVVGNIDISFSL